VVRSAYCHDGRLPCLVAVFSAGPCWCAIRCWNSILPAASSCSDWKKSSSNKVGSPFPAFGWFLSYEHWWSRRFTSTFVYSMLDVDNQKLQAPDAFKKTIYTSGNLVWTPVENWLLGVELLWGQPQDKNGEYGTDVRTQVTTRLSF
jgi:hypothetical protein